MCLLLLAAYTGWIMTGTPDVRIDYVAEWNVEIEATSIDDRAWPLYEKALAAYERHPPELATAMGLKPGQVVLGDPMKLPPDHPALVAWVTRNQLAVDRFVEASERSTYGRVYEVSGEAGPEGLSDSPDDPPPLLSIVLPDLSSVRDLSTAAIGRAWVRAGKADPEGAWSDLLAVQRTGRLLRGRRMLVEHLVGASLVRDGAEAARRVLFKAGYEATPQLLRTWAHTWAGAMPQPFAAGSGVVEKEFMLDTLQRLFSEGWTGNEHLLPDKVALLEPFVSMPSRDGEHRMPYAYYVAVAAMHADRNDTLAILERCWRLMEDDFTRPLYDPQHGAFDRFVHQLHARSPWKIGRYTLLTKLMPSIARYGVQLRRASADHEATLVCVALAAFKRHTGGYARALAELVPDYIPSLPIDPYDGKPLKYRLGADGGEFVLYSVAGDFTDNDGTSEHAWAPSHTSPAPKPVDYIFWPPRP